MNKEKDLAPPPLFDKLNSKQLDVLRKCVGERFKKIDDAVSSGERQGIFILQEQKKELEILKYLISDIDQQILEINRTIF